VEAAYLIQRDKVYSMEPQPTIEQSFPFDLRNGDAVAIIQEKDTKRVAILVSDQLSLSEDTVLASMHRSGMFRINAMRFQTVAAAAKYREDAEAYWQEKGMNMFVAIERLGRAHSNAERFVRYSDDYRSGPSFSLVKAVNEEEDFCYAGPLKFKRTKTFRVYFITIGVRRRRFRLLSRFDNYDDALRFCRDQYIHRHGSVFVSTGYTSAYHPTGEHKEFPTKYADRVSKACDAENDRGDDIRACLVISQKDKLEAISLEPHSVFGSEMTKDFDKPRA